MVCMLAREEPQSATLHGRAQAVRERKGSRPEPMPGGSYLASLRSLLLPVSLPFHVVLDPLDDDVRNFQVVIVLHEHVAVAENADVRQVDVGNVTARRVELRELGWAGLHWARRWVMIALHDQDRDVLQDVDVRRSEVPETSGLELDDAFNSRLVQQRCSGRERARLGVTHQDGTAEIPGELRHSHRSLPRGVRLGAKYAQRLTHVGDHLLVEGQGRPWTHP